MRNRRGHVESRHGIPMGEKVRVLHFVTSFHAGGTERHVTNLLRAHDRSRFEILVGSFRNIGPLSAELGDIAERVVEFPISRLYGPGTWAQQLRAAAYMRANRIQVLQSYGFYANCFAIPAARLAAVPVIIASIRDIRTTWTPNQRSAERWVCKLAHSIMTNAEAGKLAIIADGHDPAKITVIGNGVDLGRFTPAGRESTVRRDFGIPAGAALVGVVARIDECKGLEFFVEAAAIVSRALPEVRFVIIGETARFPKNQAYRAALEERSRRLGLGDRLILAGNRTDIPGVLAELDVSVLPSLSESLPNAILESMAAGVPVVATTVGGIPEVIVNEVSGLLVAPRDAPRLAAAMERLLRNPDFARGLANRGRATVEAKFSLELMARSTEEHYISLLRQRRGRR